MEHTYVWGSKNGPILLLGQSEIMTINHWPHMEKPSKIHLMAIAYFLNICIAEYIPYFIHVSHFIIGVIHEKL
jgi:hypothetical protein